MEIEYLKKLVEYPLSSSNYGQTATPNEPLSMAVITQLESTYNNGYPFPKALRELLYLAGSYCYCLVNNVYDPDDYTMQVKLQDFITEELQFMGYPQTRPFYGIDQVYPGNFRLVYLDEGDDPIVYGVDESDDTLQPTEKTLSELINYVVRMKHRL